MLLGTVALGVVSLLTAGADATALTYKLGPNTKECFFANVEQKQAKVSFYFAVSLSRLSSSIGLQQHVTSQIQD